MLNFLEKKFENFKNINSIFLQDYSTKEKITYKNFYLKFKRLEKKILKLKKDKIYLLDVSNNIKSIILIITFVLCRMKIMLKDENSSLENFNIEKIQAPIINIKINNQLQIFSKQINENILKDKNYDILIMSSGSTGKGKIVKLKYDKALLNSFNMGLELKLNYKNVHLMLMPLYHVNSLFFSIFSTFLFKQKLIIDSNFSIKNFWKIIKKYNVKSTSISPTNVKYLNILNEKNRNKSLKKVICASSFLSKQDFYEFYKKFKILIIQGYGLSEATNFSSIMPSNEKLRKKLNYHFHQENYVTIGHALKDNSLHILHKNKICTQENIIGEILINGKFLYEGYLGEKKLPSKYLKTGDIGYFKSFERKKYFFITARSKEIIKFKDETIYPIDVENYILKYLNSNLDLFCFKIVKSDLENIGCAIEVKNFNNKIKKKLDKMVNEKKYKYLPSNFFVVDLKKFKTKTLKPKRNYLSNYLIKKLEKKSYNNRFIYL